MNLPSSFRRFYQDTHNARLFALLVFIIGLMMGIEFAKVLCASSKNQSLYMKVNIRSHIKENELLKEGVSVLCWMPANISLNKTESNDAVQLTWGKRCNKLVVLNKNPNLELSLQYVFDHFYNDAHWFLKADPNNFVLMENLRMFLSKHDANEPAAFGHLVKLGESESMGKDVLYDNLYVLSKGALNAIVKRGLRSKEFLDSLKESKKSSPLNYCLQNLGIPMGRQELGVGDCNKFLSRPHCYKIMPNATTAEDMDQSCCSPNIISFSSVQNNVMYFYDYLIYKMHIYNVK